MRAVVQRVAFSRVVVQDELVSETEGGLLVLLGVGQEDASEDARYLLDKVLNLRVFEDEAGKMNLSVKDIEGELMIISQFTLYGDARKGRRPSFITAASPEKGRILYEEFVALAEESGLRVGTGKFKHHMGVHLVNDGPVTILLDSKKQF